MKGRIWLTGDAHHMSMNGTDQILLNKNGFVTTEVELCEPYLEISNQYGFEPTLFFTGKSVAEESHKIKELISKYKFSIGGHTYSAYQPIILSKISKKLVDSPFLNKKFQYNDIKKTSDVIKNRLGVKINYWRNHAYQSDGYTNNILSKEGFTRVSNKVDTKLKSFEKIHDNLYSYPINTLPDHENLPHSTEHKKGMNPSHWVDMNVDYVKNIVKEGGIATLLLHPLCMFLEDEFYFMKKILSTISKYN